MNRFYLAFIICCGLELAGCASIIQPGPDAASEMVAQVSRIPASEAQIPHGCYTKIYVPARYAVNTRGKLILRSTTQFEIEPGSDMNRWNHVRNPAIYLETRKLIEPDHFTLHPVPCPGGSAADTITTASVN